MHTEGQDGKVPGLKGPTLVERALFPLRLVLSRKSKNIPYNCLNPKIVKELLNLRRDWTLLKFQQKGDLKKDEVQVMMKVYGSAWFKEYAFPFTIVIITMLAFIIGATATYGMMGASIAAVLAYAAYAWWVSATMNVIRPGELETLLPYLRLDGADRAYLEAVDALSKTTLEPTHSLQILGVLNNLLEQDFQLQKQLGTKPTSINRDSETDLSTLQARAAETAGTTLGDVYAETLRLAETRGQTQQKPNFKRNFFKPPADSSSKSSGTSATASPNSHPSTRHKSRPPSRLIR